MKESFNFLGMTTDHGISVIALTLVTLPLILRVLWDWYQIQRKVKEPNHTKHTWWTGIGMLLASLVVWRIEPVRYYIQPLLLSFGIFAMFFDYLLNILRGKPFFYIDLGNDGKQSWFDKQYEKMGPGILLGVKLWVALVCFSVYFYMSYIVG